MELKRVRVPETEPVVWFDVGWDLPLIVVDDDKAIVQVIIKVAITEDRQAMRACVTGSGRSS